jgi:hypothetical protein
MVIPRNDLPQFTEQVFSLFCVQDLGFNTS